MNHPSDSGTHTAHAIAIVAGRDTRDLAAAVAASYGVPLCAVEAETFASSESYVRFAESVRARHVAIVQQTARPANDALMEVLLLIDAARLASAASITCVFPHYGYGRQDKKSALREPISARLVAKMLEAAGTDRVVAMDLHTGQIQGFFSIPADHLTAMPLLCEHVAARQQDGTLPAELLIVSPDAGRAKLANAIAEDLDAELRIMVKRRPRHNRAEVTLVVGDVEGRDALIVDDMIDTAGTLAAGARALLEAGARSVRAMATHGLFSGDAYARLGGWLAEVIVTDTIPASPAEPEFITRVPVAPLIAASLRSVHEGGSLSAIFGERNQIF